MKNMKIAVTADQPIEEIVRELNKRNYRQVDSVRNARFIVTYDFGYFVSSCSTNSTHKLTTLAELKRMK